VAIHGAFSGAKGFERDTGLSELADREGFIVVYPNGIGLFGLFRHWNSGHCCGKALKDGIDDVGFVTTVVERISSDLRVDRSRVFVVGNSNGGMLAYRIAAERPRVLAAVAAVSATIGGRPSAKEEEWIIPEPAAAVPMIVVHGREDRSVPYDGGNGKGGMTSVPVRDSVAFWVERNGCGPTPVAEWLREGRVQREIWQGSPSGAAVELVTIQGWGHDWPGPRFTNRLDATNPLHGFDALEVIWEFFERHRRTEP
jgi:polyhydroxybutyrate depolymerase